MIFRIERLIISHNRRHYLNALIESIIKLSNNKIKFPAGFDNGTCM